MNIKAIDISNLTNTAFENLFSITCRIADKYGLLKRFKNADAYQNLFLSPLATSGDELFVIEDDTTICGILSFVKSADWSGKEQYKLTIYICDPIPNQPIIDCLSQLIDNKLQQHEEFAIITYNNELNDLITKYPHKVNLKANAYTLTKKDIDIGLINNALTTYQSKNNDLRMIYTDTISEEYIEQYCNLFMETQEDMPDVKEAGFVRYALTPEKQRQLNDSNTKRNFTHHCYMVFNSANEMIAKTNVSVNNNNPQFPYQFMVGVKQQYRGRGLGRWLYAAMYKKLFEEVAFEKVLVLHHPENNHMINISEWIGYKYSYLETTILLSRHKQSLQ